MNDVYITFIPQLFQTMLYMRAYMYGLRVSEVMQMN